MWVGSVETRNYTFVAYDNTPEAVKDLLIEAWKQHQEDTGAWLEFESLDANIREIESGKVYCE